MSPSSAPIIRVPSDDLEWQALMELRWRVLRAPWGQPRGSEQDAFESQAIHRVAVVEPGKIIGTGRLHNIGEREGQVRYMAVDDAWRNRGIGSALLAALELAAFHQGMDSVFLEARESGIAFYQRHGYVVTGAGKVMFGEIRHVRMIKQLGSLPAKCPANTAS
jgi:ribosomal protein S18 acetylase RimI-like enzyme